MIFLEQGIINVVKEKPLFYLEQLPTEVIFSSLI